MKVVIEEVNNDNIQLELGDIVQNKGETYLVIECRGNYLLRNMNGYTGLSGLHDSLEGLSRRFNTRESLKDAKVYRSSEYELVLRKKGGN